MGESIQRKSQNERGKGGKKKGGTLLPSFTLRIRPKRGAKKTEKGERKKKGKREKRKRGGGGERGIRNFTP